MIFYIGPLSLFLLVAFCLFWWMFGNGWRALFVLFAMIVLIAIGFNAYGVNQDNCAQHNADCIR